MFSDSDSYTSKCKVLNEIPFNLIVIICTQKDESFNECLIDNNKKMVYALHLLLLYHFILIYKYPLYYVRHIFWLGDAIIAKLYSYVCCNCSYDTRWKSFSNGFLNSKNKAPYPLKYCCTTTKATSIKLNCKFKKKLDAT